MNEYSNWETDNYQAFRAPEAVANMLYNKISQRGLVANLKRLIGRVNKSQLSTLTQIKRQIQILGQESAGKMTVDTERIVGTASEGRTIDFDIDFRPLQTHNKERWLGVAAALIRGRNLGRVALIQVGNIYFVEDGHHRISVAKAMGQQVIEATVTRLVSNSNLEETVIPAVA